MTWLWIALGSLLGLVLIMLVVGMLLPVGHVARRRIALKAPLEKVFEVIADVDGWPTWQPGLKSVERLQNDHFRQVGSFGPMTLAVIERTPPVRFITKIADPELAFGGTWTWALASERGKTTLTLTEDGQVKNPLFRFLSRFVFGHHSTIEQYLRALAKKLEEDVQPYAVAGEES